MRENRCRGSLMICLAVLISFLVSHLPLGSTPILQKGTAEHLEFEVDKFDENITISEYSYQFIDFNFQEGEEIEIVFTLFVKQGLPINVWFMNEDNYLLFSSGAEQFLYYIDGSEQEVVYTKNIVTLKEYDIYKLVMVNYNNQTVEVNVVYELRTYTVESVETPSEDTSIYIYALLILVIILAILLMALAFKVRKYKQVKPSVTTKGPSKKTRKRKVKKAKPRVSEKTSSEKSDSREVKETEPEESETPEEKQEESEVTKEISPSFCGYCGKPVDTPYCIYCGYKI